MTATTTTPAAAFAEAQEALAQDAEARADLAWQMGDDARETAAFRAAATIRDLPNPYEVTA